MCQSAKSVKVHGLGRLSHVSHKTGAPFLSQDERKGSPSEERNPKKNTLSKKRAVKEKLNQSNFWPLTTNPFR